MKRRFLIFAALLIGGLTTLTAQGPSGTYHYSLQLKFDPAFADGAQVVIHERPGMSGSPAIVWLSGTLDPSNLPPLPLPKLKLTRVIKTPTDSDREESEATLEIYGRHFGCALDLKHSARPPAANTSETYEISLDGNKITTLTPAWVATWAFDPGGEVFLPLQPRSDNMATTVQFRAKVRAHPAMSGPPHAVSFRRNGKQADATENAGAYSASLAANGAPDDPRLFIKVTGSAGVAEGVVPWMQTGPLVFIVGDHGANYFRSAAGAGNMAGFLPHDDQGAASLKQPTRCWYWDSGASRWKRSVGDRATAFASARYFFDGWRAAASLMETESRVPSATVAGFVFVDEAFPAIIDHRRWEPGLRSAPMDPTWAPPNSLRLQVGEPAVVMWCAGLDDARARTWKVIFDPAAHANEASEEYLKQLREALEARIALWTQIATVQPAAKLPRHVVIPPAEAFAAALTFDSPENPGGPSRIGAQTVQNALSSPKASWISVSPPPTTAIPAGSALRQPAFNSARSYWLGWAVGLQCTLPAGPD